MIPARILKAAEIICWCAGIALVATYFGFRADGEAERRAAISAFEAAAASARTAPQPAPAAAKDNPRAPLTYRSPNKAHWSQGRIRAYRAAWATAGEPPGMPVAVLRIPSVSVEVPVYAADTARNMNRGAVLVAGTPPPNTEGNTAITAHRDGYFRALKDVVVGDVLTVQTLSGVRRYRVTSLHVVEPTDVSVLRRTPVPSVTLVTCYPFYFVGSAPHRYIVRAVELGRGDPPANRPAVRTGAARHPAGPHAKSATIAPEGGRPSYRARHSAPRLRAAHRNGRPVLVMETLLARELCRVCAGGELT